MWSWELEDDTLLHTDLGFTKCGEMNTGNRPFIDTSTQAYYIDLPYGYISLKDSANHKIYSGNAIGVEATLWTEYELSPNRLPCRNRMERQLHMGDLFGKIGLLLQLSG